MNESPITPAMILQLNQLDNHFFLRLKGTDKYYHLKGNNRYCFRDGFMLALIIDEFHMDRFECMLSTGEVELVKASDVLL